MTQPPTSITHIARYAWLADKTDQPTPAVRRIAPVRAEPDTLWRRGDAQSREKHACGPDRVTLSHEAQIIRELQMRDRQVRAHEAAHAAVGGAHAGHPVYTLEQGPDGRSYAIGGEVSMSTAAVTNDPQATLDKAQTVRRAALAPAEPSDADRAIAAKATQMALKARHDIAARDNEHELFAETAAQNPASPLTPPAGSLLNLRA
jgi:hypothetical protein